MTKVYLTNSDNTIATAGPYYIEINAVKIEYDYQSNVKTILEYPKGTTNQGTVSETYFIDMQQRAKVLTITGRIDRYSNRGSGWLCVIVHDVGVVRQRLEYMWNRGGVNKLMIGKGDGYYDVTNTSAMPNGTAITGVIMKMKISESGGDHYARTVSSEDYPSSVVPSTAASDQVKIVGAYDVMFTFHEGELQ